MSDGLQAAVICGNIMHAVAAARGSNVDDLHAQTFDGMRCERAACASKNCLRLRFDATTPPRRSARKPPRRP